MVQKFFKLKSVFENLYNDISLGLSEYVLTSTEWEALQDITKFLELAASFTKQVSGKNYATITLQSVMYHWLIGHCEKTINQGRQDTQETVLENTTPNQEVNTSNSVKAAKMFLSKI